jgi:beta-glucosidase
MRNYNQKMMKFGKRTGLFLLGTLTAATLTSCGPKWKEEKADGYNIVYNQGGSTLGYSPSSGVKLLTVDRFAFKDLNKNNQLDPYEDWRLMADERAADLASRLNVSEIAGLMLYSAHQSIPAADRGFRAGTYNGKPLSESEAASSDLTDQQKKFLTDDNLRHVLITSVESPEIAARWNNNAQALVESIGFGIPANNSSDPRHGTVSNAEYNEGAGGRISMWPGPLGLAATFNPQLVESFGRIASKEYRALGITTALSPQVDIASDPRWYRTPGTFGESPKLSADIARAYIDGFQSSADSTTIANGWGYESVNAMVKHWPGGGSGEAGRDAHYGFGKYAVYPGNNFEAHMIPFTEGAFKLNGATRMASAVMPYYTISFGQDTQNKENVANSYNTYIINDLLRQKYHYDGVVCTDWGITGDQTSVDQFMTGKPWGVESLTVVQRHYKVLMAGVDQFGGNNDAAPVIEAYELGVKEHGEEMMRQRFEQSAIRLLRNIFRTGLFENPYVSPETTQTIVGNADFMKAGYEAQLKSVVMLKNKDQILPLKRNQKVYVPKQFTPASRNFLGMETPEKFDYPVNMDIVKKYFSVTDNPEEADLALVFIDSPDSGNGYSRDDVAKGGNGYMPISLQYGPYTATEARATSLAGGDPMETFTNRSYKGKTVRASNITDLGMVNETRKKMNNKPVIVSVHLSNAMIFGEFEKNANAILAHFGVQNQALFDLLTGASEPSALLPLQMPANMSTVESQFEDVPLDVSVYTDEQGNKYDFGFGLNWNGVIDDERTVAYHQ